MQNFSLDTSCEHGVLDDDSRFVIDADTRAITYTGETEIRLVQKDHNSERCTFEIPKVIDGHDMSKCNVIRIHFVNISAEDPNITNPGLFEVDMTSFGPLSDDPSKLTFSWLVCDDATQLVGTLSFVVELMCRNSDNLVEYAWHTGVYTGGVIERGIDNSNLILGSDKYYDTLNTWIRQIELAGQNTLEQTTTRFMAEAESYAEVCKRAITEHAIDGLSIDGVIVHDIGFSEKRVLSQSATTRILTDTSTGLLDSCNVFYASVNASINKMKEELKPLPDKAIYREVPLSQFDDNIAIASIELGKTYVVKSKKTSDSWGFTSMLDSATGTFTEGDTTNDYQITNISIDLPEVDDWATSYNVIRLSKLEQAPTVVINNPNLPSDFTNLRSVVAVDIAFDINFVRQETQQIVYDAGANINVGVPTTELKSYDCIITGNIEALYEVDIEQIFARPAINFYATGITNITKTKTEIVDGVITHTYTILFDDGTTTTFDVKDGVGIASVSKTAEDRHEDTYAIELTNGSTTTFKVPSSTAYNVLLDRISALEKLHGIDNGEAGGKLFTPAKIRFLSNGLALWDAVQNAIGYRYRVYSASGSYDEYKLKAFATTITNQSLTNGQSISVMAIGDGVNYFNSDWSEPVTYISDSGDEPDVPEDSVYVYYGVGTVTGKSDDPFASEFVTGLTNAEEAGRVCSFTVSPATQYIYFAAPKNYCINGDGVDIAVFTVNNFSGGFLSPQTLTIEDVEYYVYRSANKLTGTIAVNVT